MILNNWKTILLNILHAWVIFPPIKISDYFFQVSISLATSWGFWFWDFRKSTIWKNVWSFRCDLTWKMFAEFLIGIVWISNWITFDDIFQLLLLFWYIFVEFLAGLVDEGLDKSFDAAFDGFWLKLSLIDTFKTIRWFIYLPPILQRFHLFP